MTERWVSQPKYWCQYCKVYLTDNKSTRTIHDSGLRHKENVERYLREVSKGKEKAEKESKAIDAEVRKALIAGEKAYHQKDLPPGFVPSFGPPRQPTFPTYESNAPLVFGNRGGGGTAANHANVKSKPLPSGRSQYQSPTTITILSPEAANDRRSTPDDDGWVTVNVTKLPSSDEEDDEGDDKSKVKREIKEEEDSVDIQTTTTAIESRGDYSDDDDVGGGKAMTPEEWGRRSKAFEIKTSSLAKRQADEDDENPQSGESIFKKRRSGGGKQFRKKPET